MTVMRAQQIAQQITDSYTDATQFEAIAARGCGEWELAAAAELLGGEDDCTVAEVLDEIVEICKSH
jgi:hypothetical protein